MSRLPNDVQFKADEGGVVLSLNDNGAEAEYSAVELVAMILSSAQVVVCYIVLRHVARRWCVSLKPRQPNLLCMPQYRSGVGLSFDPMNDWDRTVSFQNAHVPCGYQGAQDGVGEHACRHPWRTKHYQCASNAGAG